MIFVSKLADRDILEPYHTPSISKELMVKIEERLNYRNLMMKKDNNAAACPEQTEKRTE